MPVAAVSAVPPSSELEHMPLERLEHEITELASHINAATCRWLLLVGELERREGWRDWGCRSCAHWLSVRCGLGLTAAREQVRVARSLSELPEITACFSRGELSYSQVRALTRVATPELEDQLLTTARHATGGQLEILVRSYRGVLAKELEAVNCAHRDRFLVYSHEDDGSLVINARLPAEEGELVLAALEAARDAQRAPTPDGKGDAPPDPGASPVEDASAEAFQPADGTLPAAVDQLEDASAEARPTFSVRNADAIVLMAETVLARGCTRSSGGDRYQLMIHVDASTLARDEDGACHIDNGPALHPETARRLACDAGLVRILERDGRPLSVGRKTRSVPPALARALRSRDTGCAFPGCGERRFVDAHHVEHWAHGGRTELSNLVQLCRCHHRLVHEGGFGVERGAGGALVFRRPDGRAIPKRPRARGGDRHALVARNVRAGVEVAPESCVPRWYGERLKRIEAVEGLASRDSRLPGFAPN